MCPICDKKKCVNERRCSVILYRFQVREKGIA